MLVPYLFLFLLPSEPPQVAKEDFIQLSFGKNALGKDYFTWSFLLFLGDSTDSRGPAVAYMTDKSGKPGLHPPPPDTFGANLSVGPDARYQLFCKDPVCRLHDDHRFKQGVRKEGQKGVQLQPSPPDNAELSCALPICLRRRRRREPWRLTAVRLTGNKSDRSLLPGADRGGGSEITAVSPDPVQEVGHAG